MFEHAHAIVRNAVEEEHPGAVGPGGAHLPSAQQDAICGSNVERLTLHANLRERGVGLLDQVGSERSTHRAQERRRDQPAQHYGQKRREEQQNQGNPEQAAHFQRTEPKRV